MEVSYKEKILKDMEELPEDRIREVFDYIEFIRKREEEDEDDATKEIMNDKEFMESLKKGESDIKKGLVSKWDDIKRNV